MIFQKLPVQYLKAVAEDVFLLRFSSVPIAAPAQPGQFVMVQPTKFMEPILPRPFSIHRIHGNQVEILFKVIGQGTKQLAGLKKGDLLEVKGPLGQGFHLEKGQEPILVAGGIGVAPLLFFAERWKHSRQRRPEESLKIFIGARTKAELLCLKEFERAGAEIFATTEDGSWGEKGLITTLLKKKVKRISPNQTLLVCGPNPMLKTVRDWAVQKEISCQLSLETRMACGLGACLGCAVEWKKGAKIAYVNVCQQGPVFEAQEVFWDE